ncbi:deoxyribodipyrimidine photo-lyase [Robertkochia marina]|uniref:Deoxyribodipyrimidine photo-lyase n=1 Tax=Robertkochia marina TaxID=1227945 RepID=A0A4S3M1T2_9FLAO|nr:deoxyribodipyrimidine photo-lyase [Robertkochia marina]TRZ44614.1 deoxyribodipyrimidine photo-lyase [Robertkochia marina]
MDYRTGVEGRRWNLSFKHQLTKRNHLQKPTVNVFWFRRDLRLDDNKGLQKALKGNLPVLPIFIFDKNILDKLPRVDARVQFIHEQLQKMRQTLQKEYSSSLGIYRGTPVEVFSALLDDFEIESVFTNHDYEPYAERRDNQVYDLFEREYIEFNTYKDQVIFEKSEVVKDDGDPYVVYTPYMKKWKQVFADHTLEPFEIAPFADNFFKTDALPNTDLSDIGFKPSPIKVPDYDLTPETIQNYEDTRNFPAIDGTSRIGPHLRFGTVGIRRVFQKALAEKNETFLNELIWREFFMQILWHYPHTRDESFKKKYDRIEWRNKEDEFQKWCEGKTGYPLVDAGMRELNETGYMHNRVRMLVGSFLCKHLLIDWRWGEAYFAEKLLDYEMSSNVGNWQWVAGSGVDAAPYFRIFNPTTQIKKFDKDREYIKNWIPEVDTDKYPEPMVDHKEARERCLATYKKALG